MLRFLQCAAALALLPLLPVGARAQARPAAPPADSAYPLSPLDVTVTRGAADAAHAAAAVSTVGAAEIQRFRPTIGLDESLALVPGLIVDNRYNFSLGTRIAIRGLGARAAFGVRGVRILMDGIPLTGPDGQANLTNLDLGGADRIQVLRGPASALFGNAAGGVISVRTEAAPPGPAAAEARLVVGTDGRALGNLRKYEARVGGHVAAGSYYVALSHLAVDGFREHSRTKNTLLNARWTTAPDARSSLTFLVNAVDEPEAESPGSLPLDSARLRPEAAWPGNVATGSGERARQVQGGVAYARTLGTGRLDVSVYGLGRTLHNPLPYTYIDLRRGGGGVRGAYGVSGRLAGRAAALVTGVDAELQRDGRRERDNAGGVPGATVQKDESDRVWSVGPFAQGRLEVLPRLEASAGIRWDRVRFATTDRRAVPAAERVSGARTLEAVSPRAGLLYAVSARLRAYADIGTSFQTPTTTELVNAPPAPGQPCCAPGFNPDLQPERALEWEAGLKGGVGPLHIDVALFTMTVRDELVPFTVVAAPDRAFFRNAGRSRHRGVEVGLDAPVGRHLDAAASYTYSDYVFLDDGLPDQEYEGNRIPGVAPHHLAARLGWHGAGAFAEAQLDHVSRYVTSDANTASAVNPAHTVIDLRLGGQRRLGALRLAPFVGVGNIFDVRYNASVVVNAFADRYYEPAPGRNFYVGITLPYGGWRLSTP